MTDNLQERNEQVINNIKSLQTMELDLYNSLENQTLTSDQKQQIIDRINQLSQMRTNMYANLKNAYSNYQQNVSASRNTLNDQMVSIDVIENELNDSKRRLNLLQAEKNNKIRLVGINTYYGKQYNAHKQIMKTVVYICIPILILTILTNKGILPAQLNALMSGIIIIIGIILVGYQIIDLSNRDNMNFDEYDWYFDKNTAASSTSTTTTSTTGTDPWATSVSTCIGAECCNEYSTYDSAQNKCIPTVEQTTTATTTTETFVSGVLSKYASCANFPQKRLHNENIEAYNYDNLNCKYNNK